MASVASALVQKLNRFFRLNQDELASLAGLEARRRRIPAHTEIVHERQEGHHAFILQEGWACAYKLLPDGGRQVRPAAPHAGRRPAGGSQSDRRDALHGHPAAAPRLREARGSATKLPRPSDSVRYRGMPVCRAGRCAASTR